MYMTPRQTAEHEDTKLRQRLLNYPAFVPDKTEYAYAILTRDGWVTVFEREDEDE